MAHCFSSIGCPHGPGSFLCVMPLQLLRRVAIVEQIAADSITIRARGRPVQVRRVGLHPVDSWFLQAKAALFNCVFDIILRLNQPSKTLNAFFPGHCPNFPTSRISKIVAGTEATQNGDFSTGRFPLHTNRDVMTVLAELLSNQHLFFAGVSKEWRHAWGKRPKTTRAITAETSPSQLQWSFDGGLGKYSRIRQHLAEHIAEHCGGVDVLRCAYLNGCPIPEKACFKAAARGKLEMVQWALGGGCGWREVLCRAAAAGGSLRILMWAHANGCPWDETTCSEAASSGNLDILRWARVNNCPWDEETCSKAAGGGHLGILQWARDRGCRWDETTCSEAASSGYLDILRWARSKGCPWGDRTC